MAISRVKTWGAEILTYADLNAEFDNVINNLTPANIDDESATDAAARATSDPYPDTTLSKATTLQGEIKQLRYLIAQITGKTYWYQDPDGVMLANPLTTAGDIIYGGTSGATTRKAIGTALQVLQVNSGATAPEWAASPQSVLTTQGDLLYASNANTLARLAKGTAAQVLSMNSGATAPEWTTLQSPANATMVTLTNQTSVTFGSIPTWVKKITIMFNGVSTNGTAQWRVQLGDSGGAETDGYTATYSFIGSGVSPAGDNVTDGFPIYSAAAANTISGAMVLTMMNAATFAWTCHGVLNYSNAVGINLVSGVKALSAALDRVVLGTTNGTDQFDAGTINILYE